VASNKIKELSSSEDVQEFYLNYGQTKINCSVGRFAVREQSQVYLPKGVNKSYIYSGSERIYYDVDYDYPSVVSCCKNCNIRNSGDVVDKID